MNENTPNPVGSRESLKGLTLFITGATRGIGLSIAERAARDGANIAVVGKTVDPHPRLPGTLASACAAIEEQGGKALALPCDIRDDEALAAAVDKAASYFSGIDIVVNNASAISLTPTSATDLKRYDLMNGVNARGTFATVKHCLPHLERSQHAHILTLSPPLDLRPEYFAPHLAYSIAKFGMSLCTLGWSHELAPKQIGVNSLWPKTVIDTAAVRNLLGGEEMARRARKPEIVADAAHAILCRAPTFTGRFLLDEEVLRDAGIRDFGSYSVDPSQEPVLDLFLPREMSKEPDPSRE